MLSADLMDQFCCIKFNLHVTTKSQIVFQVLFTSAAYPAGLPLVLYICVGLAALRFDAVLVKHQMAPPLKRLHCEASFGYANGSSANR